MPRLRRAWFAALVLMVAPEGAAAQDADSADPYDPAAGASAVEAAFGEGVPPAVAGELASLMARPQQTAETIDQIVSLWATFDGRVSEMLGSAGVDGWSPPATPPQWLAEESVSPAYRGVVSLAASARLHAGSQYEECLAWLAGVEPDHVAAPHLLHFYRAVAQHQLVRLAEAKASAEKLLEARDTAARRHVVIAELILRDTTGVEPESLDHLARTMNDVRRRLALGRSAQPEQDLQQQVLDALDKMIEDAEKQQQQQQQQQASSSAPSAPSQAMQDSRPGDLKGPGEVDPRDVAAGGDWGSLPPEERERVTQQIGRDFPGYYRDLIEAYFRSLATPPSDQQQPDEDASRVTTP